MVAGLPSSAPGVESSAVPSVPEQAVLGFVLVLGNMHVGSPQHLPRCGQGLSLPRTHLGGH